MEKIGCGMINVVVSVYKYVGKNGVTYEAVCFENDTCLGQKVSFEVKDDTPTKLIAKLIKDKVCTPIVEPTEKVDGKK